MYWKYSSGTRHALQLPHSRKRRWEMDIVVSVRTNHCIVTPVERVTGATIIGWLRCRKVVDVNPNVIEMTQENRQVVSHDHGR